jgi:hypothetical protein
MIRDTPIDELKPHPDNPRKGNVEKIARSIQKHGFHGALVAQASTSRIIAGEHRWRAAQLVGLAALPVDWKDVTDEQAVQIMLADNRASDDADYDTAQLADLLRDLPDPSAALWDQPDVDALLRSVAPAEAAMATSVDPGLRDLHETYGDATVRQLVLGYARPHYQWVTARMAELRERFGVDSNAALVARLLEDASGKKLGA